MALATVAVVFMALNRMASEVNDIDRQHLARSVTALIASGLGEISSVTADDAAWTEAYNQLYGRPSQSFLTDVLIEGTLPGRPFDSIMVVSGTGRVFWAFSNGIALAPGQSIVDPADVRALLRQSETEPNEAVTALANAADGPKLTGLRVITPNDGLLPADVEPRYLVVARHLDDERLATLGRPFGIFDLRWHDRPQLGMVAVELTSAAGNPAGMLTCAPRNPGGEAYDRAFWLMTAVLTMLFVVVGFLVLTIWKILSAMYAGEETARHDAYHDALSGLANRLRFNAALSELSHRDEQPVVTVLFADLDGFKEVNDTYGHEVGDRLIRAVAAGFACLVDGRGLLARLGGDEFAVVLEGYASMTLAAELGGRMIEFLSEPFEFDGQTVKVGASIGIASSDDEAISNVELVRRADVAMYAAKSRGKNRAEIYFPDMDADRAEKAELAVALRAAIDNDELQVHYQPVIRAGDGRVGMVEALVRWIRPGIGPISPAVFLPVAEEAGFTELLGTWVLRRVFREARTFPESCKVAVNVFPSQFGNPLFDETLKAILDQEGFPAERLELDITERFLISYPERTQRMIESLHRLGIGVALDDFGTGFSSISYLRRFGFDKVKIDRSVIIDVVSDPASQKLVASTVALADALGVEVTAEGIEREEEAEMLKAAGCHELQGYRFGAPTTAAELVRRLKRDNGAAARRTA
jgi:diguanylate cyclase (GGDEF)-like protein